MEREKKRRYRQKKNLEKLNRGTKEKDESSAGKDRTKAEVDAAYMKKSREAAYKRETEAIFKSLDEFDNPAFFHTAVKEFQSRCDSYKHTMCQVCRITRMDFKGKSTMSTIYVQSARRESQSSYQTGASTMAAWE